MNTAELARKVRTIEITTRKAVTATFAGDYRSAFKGRGMEFDEVREYQVVMRGKKTRKRRKS